MRSVEVVIRLAGADDRSAVEDALLWACNWSTERQPLDRATALIRPEIAHYVTGWPAAGDLGVVADIDGPVGAAWLRYLPTDDPGYGFVAMNIPELSIGVHPRHRGRGIGRELLRALSAAATERGILRVSLSVERANRARELYLGKDSASSASTRTPPPCSGSLVHPRLRSLPADRIDGASEDVMLPRARRGSAAVSSLRRA